MAAPRRLRPAVKVLLVSVVAAGALVTLVFGAATAAIYRAGSIRVEVQSTRGTDLSLKIPAGLANLAIAVTPTAPFRELTQDLRDELEPWSDQVDRVWPAVHRSYRELADAPDFVLVEFHGPGEDVQVRKHGSSLKVDIRSEDEEIHVVIPLPTLERALTKLERLAG
jgi:hypothetical protein